MSFYCKKCDKWWTYPIKKCLFCGGDIQEIIKTHYKIIGFTQVNIPSSKHKEVPYFNYLLEDENKNMIIIKSFEEYKIGEPIEIKE
jgi:3-hydroxybutyryl-CoA dehydrogenase